MRRSVVVLAVAALVGSTLAFAPAVTSQQAETTHQVTFTEDGTQTVQGDVPGGINLTGFTEDGVRCSSDPDAYCETILVTVEQPVADDGDPDTLSFGLGEVVMDTTADVQGGDFDITVFESDAEASRGSELASSGNFLACATFCDVPLVQPNQCEAADECLEFNVSTSELGGTKHYLVEVVYFAAVSGHTTNISYTRLDDNAPSSGGDTGDGTGTESAPAPADSADPVDVTGGFEPAGDWGGGGDSAALGDALGQDLTAAFVEYGEDTFTFTIEVANLPAAGGMPEATRYTWDFDYNGFAFELDGKFTNYSRGACDPTAGSCPPPRDPGVGFFALRGNCVTEGSVTTCEELGSTNAAFDADAGTITIPVPAPLLAADGVAACDTIGGGTVVAQPSAFFSLSTGPQDAASAWLPFTVPHADPSLSCS